MPDDNKGDQPSDIRISEEIANFWKQPLAGRFLTEHEKEMVVADAVPGAPTAGCFDFSDGTLRGWTLDQLYGYKEDAQTKVLKRSKLDPTAIDPFTGAITAANDYWPVGGFALANSQKIALSASAKLVVWNPDVKFCEFPS